ncbi:MAG: GNAT family N-acetyltransferase [Myxococcota bacterium]
MNRLSLAEFEAQAERFDSMALASPDIDAFCSSAAWIVPAHKAFHPEQDLLLFEGEFGYLALARGHAPNLGTYLAPVEAMWGLASPLVGAEAPRLAIDAWRTLRASISDWDALWLCGLSPHGAAFKALAMLAGQGQRLFVGPTTYRHVALLEGGFEGWLSRRARAFRKGLRQAQRRTEEAGVVFEWHDAFTPEAQVEMYQRVLAVDDRSWKGLDAQGLRASNMASFYDHMTAYLAQRGALRAVFATLDGEDIAMGFGGILGPTFRGLQMSYDDRFKHLSLGNLIQQELIMRVAAEGLEYYDLGTEMDYKRRWSHPGLETVALVVRSR